MSLPSGCIWGVSEMNKYVMTVTRAEIGPHQFWHVYTVGSVWVDIWAGLGLEWVLQLILYQWVPTEC